MYLSWSLDLVVYSDIKQRKAENQPVKSSHLSSCNRQMLLKKRLKWWIIYHNRCWRLLIPKISKFTTGCRSCIYIIFVTKLKIHLSDDKIRWWRSLKIVLDCWEAVLQPQATVIVGTAVTKTMVSVFLWAAATNDTERDTSLLLNFICNGDVKADPKGARLPNLSFVFVWIHHIHHMSTLRCRRTHLYLFLQAGVGSAHIWMPAWGPDCAFLRRSWSQWGSCHCS